MRHLLYIIIILMAFTGSSCQEATPASRQEPRLPRHVQTEMQYQNSRSIIYSEGILSSAISLYRTDFHSEERAETRTGKRSEPNSRGGGKVFNACHAPRAAIISSLGSPLSHHLVTICPHVSHTSLIYVLRHIIR